MKVSPYSYKGATLRANYMTAVTGKYHTSIRLSDGNWVASSKYHKGGSNDNN